MSKKNVVVLRRLPNGTSVIGCTQRRKINPVHHLPNGTSVIEIKHKGQLFECLFDTKDYDLIKMYCWCVHRPRKNKDTFYAYTTIDARNNKKLALHQMLLPEAKEIDHISRNGLDNRRSNLRSSTDSQNKANQLKRTFRKYSSEYKGVSRKTGSKKWAAGSRVNNKAVHLGYFDSEEDAARAYDAFTIKTFGEYACLNFPVVAA